MRDWVVSAACRGQERVMFPAYGDYDPSAALALCRSCPVVVDCITDSQKWRGEMPAGVVGGIAHSTGKRRGRPVKLVRECMECGVRMYLEPESQRRLCDRCRNQTVNDVLEMGRVLERILGETG